MIRVTGGWDIAVSDTTYVHFGSATTGRQRTLPTIRGRVEDLCNEPFSWGATDHVEMEQVSHLSIEWKDVDTGG
jgi:hypothetical protein